MAEPRRSRSLLILLALLLLPAFPGSAAVADEQDLAPIRSLIDRNRLAEAETVARVSLSETEATHGGDSLQAARVMDLLVEILQRRGRWTDAEMLAFAREALEIKERLLPPAELELARSLDNLGLALKEGKDPASAEPYLERSLSIREGALGADHPDVATSLDHLAVLEKDLGKYAESLGFHERALAIRENSFGADDLKVADSLNGLGVTLRRMGDHDRARSAYERALAIREKALGPTAAPVASTLLNLANLLRITGDYSEAEPLYRRVLAIDEAQPDADPYKIAVSTSSLANLLFETDDYRGARPLYERALALMEKARGPDHPDTAVAMRNLANLLTELGDFAGAKPLFEKALAIREKALGPDHPDVALILNNLGEVKRRMGDLEAAGPLIERGLAIREKALGPEHRDVARSLRYIAALRRDQARLEEALGAMQRAIRIEEKVSGPESNMVAQDTMVLGGIMAMRGELVAARRAFDRAEAIYAKTGFDDTHRAMALVDGAKVSYLAGDFPGALDQALRGEALARDNFRQTASMLSEREAFAHEAIRSTGLDVALSVVSRDQASPVAGNDLSRIWTEVIRSRSMLLDEFAGRHRVIRSARSEGIEPRWSSVVKARGALSRLLVQGPGSGKDFADKVVSARADLEAAERALAEASSSYRLEVTMRDASFTEVAAGLPKGSALVSYVRYRQIEAGKAPSRVPAYMAFVLQAGSRAPISVSLGGAEKIDGLVRDWRTAVGSDPRSGDRDRGEEAYREAGRKLREAIWDPLGERLGRPGQVVIVPDGAIHLVSFATLPTTRGKYLLETGPTLHYSSTERSLARRDRPARGGKGLLALGGPDFNSSADRGATPSVVLLAGSAGGILPEPPSGTATYRGPSPTCTDFRSMRFEPLRASRAEVDEIESLWIAGQAERGRDLGEAIKLTGAEAIEEAFKSLAPGRRIVHVATHGFFVDPSCGTEASSSSGSGAEGLWDDPLPGLSSGENPLRLSGLAFAGANRRDEVGLSTDRDDGILTSEEIASLDLSDVEGVVLSACDTGMGKVVRGEGVLGLRRAFEVAGARSLVMALWSVEDDAARIWMSRFYEARLEGRSTAEAAREASLRVLSMQRERHQPPHPFFWGAFVSTGD